MADQSWALDATSPAAAASANAAGGAPPADEIADRTSVITARLKAIYRKTVLPVEKRYRYDYFYESPLLTDIEFDGTFFFFVVVINTSIICSLICVIAFIILVLFGLIRLFGFEKLTLSFFSHPFPPYRLKKNNKTHS